MSGQFQPPVRRTKPKMSRGRKAVYWSVGAIAGLAVIGAIGNATGAGKKNTAADSRPVAVVTSASSAAASPSQVAKPAVASVKPSVAPASHSPAAPTAVTLTGFGATQPDWTAHHTADPDNEAAWNPDSALQPTTTGGVNDAYSGVTFTGTPGRVLAYQMLFTSRSLTAAEAAVAAQLPKDAVAGSPVLQMHGTAGAQCVGITYTSATLARTIGGKDSGVVDVEFSSAKFNQLHESAVEWATLADRADEEASGISLASPC